jgi:hypothetical protein
MTFVADIDSRCVRMDHLHPRRFGPQTLLQILSAARGSAFRSSNAQMSTASGSFPSPCARPPRGWHGRSARLAIATQTFQRGRASARHQIIPRSNRSQAEVRAHKWLQRRNDHSLPRPVLSQLATATPLQQSFRSNFSRPPADRR